MTFSTRVPTGGSDASGPVYPHPRRCPPACEYLSPNPFAAARSWSEVPRSVLLTLLLTAAAWLTSVSETCQRLRGAPNDQAVRLALILRNVWGWLHLQVLAKYQPGGRHIELALLPFPQLMWWLGQQAIARFGLVDVLTTEYPIETVS